MPDLLLYGAIILLIFATVSMLLLLTEWFLSIIGDTPETDNLFDLEEEDLL